MASGRLTGWSGNFYSVNQLIYTVPTGKTSSFSVYLYNQTTSDPALPIFIYLTTGGTPTAADLIDTLIIPGLSGVEKTGLVLGAGQKLYIYTLDTAFNTSNSLSVCVYGFEE